MLSSENGRWNKGEMTKYRNYMAWIEQEGLMYAYNQFRDENYRTPLIFLPEMFVKSYQVRGSAYYAKEA